MRYIIVLVGILLFATPLVAETPCDFDQSYFSDRCSYATLADVA
jgi:hypothetical protein